MKKLELGQWVVATVDYAVYRIEIDYGKTKEELEINRDSFEKNVIKTFDTRAEAEVFAKPLLEQKHIKDRLGAVSDLTLLVNSFYRTLEDEIIYLERNEPKVGAKLRAEYMVVKEEIKTNNLNFVLEDNVIIEFSSNFIKYYTDLTKLLTTKTQEELQKILQMLSIKEETYPLAYLYDKNKYHKAMRYDASNPDDIIPPKTKPTGKLADYSGWDISSPDIVESEVKKIINTMGFLKSVDKTELEAKIAAMKSDGVEDLSSITNSKLLYSKTETIKAFEYNGIFYFHSFKLNNKKWWTGVYYHRGSIYSAVITISRRSNAKVVPVVNKWVESRPGAIGQNDLDNLQHNLTTLLRQFADKVGYEVITYEGIVDGDNILTMPWTTRPMDFSKILSVSAWVGDNGNRVSITGLHVPHINKTDESFMLNLQGNEGQNNYYGIKIDIHADGTIAIHKESAKGLADPELMLLEITFADKDVVRNELRLPKYKHIYDFLSKNDFSQFKIKPHAKYRVKLWNNGVLKLTENVTFNDLQIGEFKVIDKYNRDYALASFGAVLNINSVQAYPAFTNIELEVTNWKGIDKVEIDEWVN